MWKALVLGFVVFISLSQIGSGQTSTPSSPAPCSISKGDGKVPYPAFLRGSGIQGTVILQAIVAENGCAYDIHITRKLHPELDRLAKEAVHSWKFSPALKDGKAVKVKVQLEVEFKDEASTSSNQP